MNKEDLEDLLSKKWEFDSPIEGGEQELRFLHCPDAKNYAFLIELKDVYPGYPECGQDLRMLIAPEIANSILHIPEMYKFIKSIANDDLDRVSPGLKREASELIKKLTELRPGSEEV